MDSEGIRGFMLEPACTYVHQHQLIRTSASADVRTYGAVAALQLATQG